MAFFNESPYDPLTGKQKPKRPVTDYSSTYVRWMRHRTRPGTRQMREQERPSPSYIVDMLPPAARLENPADTIPSKHLHSSLNKIKHPVFVVRWTPDGRRLLTGSSSGEFTLWNGMGFNFETIMQAHDSAIREATWSHNDDWLLSVDHDGILKYWQPNFNNVKAIQAHDAAIRGLSFAPNDSKFVTGADDSTIKVWDFAGGIEESTLTGHGWDVKTVDWHPTKGLLVSGSKDHQVKLWDPRNGRCLTTLLGHKNTIAKTIFEPNKGNLLATCGRDSVARIFDLRMMRDVLLLRGHERSILSLTWHPIHSSLLSTGGDEGSLNHYLLDEPNAPENSITNTLVSPYDSPDPANAPAQTIYPAHKLPHAHEFGIWSMDWHPVGHIFATGSNDRITRFWTRSRPGETDCYNDRYHLGDAASDQSYGWNKHRSSARSHLTREEEEQQEMEDEADGLVDQAMPAKQPVLPGLPGIGSAAPLRVNDGSSVGGAQLSSLSSLPGMAGSLPPLPPSQQQNGVPQTLNQQTFITGSSFPPPLPLMPLPSGNANNPSNLSIPPPPIPPPGSTGQQLPASELARIAELFRSGNMSGLPPPPPPPPVNGSSGVASNASAQGLQQQGHVPIPLPGFPGFPGGLPGFPPLPMQQSQGQHNAGNNARPLSPPQLHGQNERPHSRDLRDRPGSRDGGSRPGSGSGGRDSDRNNGGGAGGGRRKRAPLPSQDEQMRETMRKGNYRRER